MNGPRLSKHPGEERRATSPASATPRCDLIPLVKAHYQALAEVRRGVCLLNAGQFASAEKAFLKAEQRGCLHPSLASYLAASLVGQGRHERAAERFAQVRQPESAATARIRQAFALRAAGHLDEAIEVLRKAVAGDPTEAELHFQLGTLLTLQGAYDEAELRFTQALNLMPNHVEAMVSQAMCCGIRGVPAAAVKYLQRAQETRPYDGRIGFLLAQAATAVQDSGHLVQVRAAIPADDPAADERGVDDLSRVIEAEPDFVDAFLSIPPGEVDASVFAMLLRTLDRALERQPEQAELHYHCGRVLERLGRRDAAIGAAERAVGLDPRFTRALILLGRLYQQTDRTADAARRLEEAVEAGADYADVHCLLGHLYRDQGRIGSAKRAYRRALVLNQKYEDAQKALDALPV